MPRYRVFGGLLDSDIAFDGLRPESSGQLSTWSFRVDNTEIALEPGIVVGAEEVSSELTITLCRTALGGMVLSYSAYGLGQFHISPDGSHIRWRPGADPWMPALRWVLLGRVMATAMYAGGTLCLHGSAVALSDGICFLAPKGYGKSTLAAALVASGALLATDDLLPIDVGPPVHMRPGVPVLRLHEDAERAVDIAGRGYERTAEDVGKARIDFDASVALLTRPHRLNAIYILAPSQSEVLPGRAVIRERVTGARALERVVRHSSIASLLSAAEARPLLMRVAAVVREVPIYVLRPVRDLERLHEVVDAIHAWHGAAAGVTRQALSGSRSL